MDHIAIYLAGKIQKGHENESKIYWSDRDLQFLKKGLSPLHISFLNPALRADDLSDQLSVFGRDMTQVYCSDIIFVDARERRGLGVGAEMLWAKMNNIPLLTLAPKDSHYVKSTVKLLGEHVENWTHPFIESLSDAIVGDLDKAINWIKEFTKGNVQNIKGPEYIKKAMQYYKGKRFKNDHPMNELARANKILKSRIDNILI